MIPPEATALGDLVGGNHSEAPGSSMAAWSDVARAGGSWVTKRSVPATGGRDREEWRLVPSGASPPMKNEESAPVLPEPSPPAPFLHSSWSRRDGVHGTAAVSGEAFTSVSTRSVEHEETSEDEPGEEWERWEEPL
jgi:hypothetical protein